MALHGVGRSFAERWGFRGVIILGAYGCLCLWQLHLLEMYDRSGGSISPGHLVQSRNSHLQNATAAVAHDSKSDQPNSSTRKDLYQILIDSKRALNRRPLTFDQRVPITAYLEPSFLAKVTIPGTGDQAENIPPRYVQPLPLRTQTPSDLNEVRYTKFQTCHDLPAALPIDRGLILDPTERPVAWNIDKKVPDSLLDCPVDFDPYLPWIHDLFPSQDGTIVEIIAQNKRRCNVLNETYVQQLEPQIALFQGVSLQSIAPRLAQQLAPNLWSPRNESGNFEPRYRLVPMEQASDDRSKFTRFLCRFKVTDYSAGGHQTILGHSLSKFPIPYEYIAWRKGRPGLHSQQGRDNGQPHTSTLRIQCPVPTLSLRRLLANDSSVMDDGTPLLHLDLVPIRTPPRHEHQLYLDPEDLGMTYYERLAKDNHFDPTESFGTNHVLPRIEASGRWSNLPVCWRPKVATKATTGLTHTSKTRMEAMPRNEKPFFLSACVWASAAFRDVQRSAGGASENIGSTFIMDTARRLEEWLHFHFLVGFDHVFFYDNSKANTNQNLTFVLEKFPPSRITRVEWAASNCNRNLPTTEGYAYEGSSQFAAENSCRTRYAPFTEWIAALDIDEYMIPMGNYTSLRPLLTDKFQAGAKIVSFRSSIAKLRWDKSVSRGSGRMKDKDVLFLDAFNCDPVGDVPKPKAAERARKQIYLSDYVLNHFVHYSLVTEKTIETYRDHHQFRRRIVDDPAEIFLHEAAEARMVHAKSMPVGLTLQYRNQCSHEAATDGDTRNGCPLGFPWPNSTVGKFLPLPPGFDSNCFVNERIEDYWIPLLRAQMTTGAFA